MLLPVESMLPGKLAAPLIAGAQVPVKETHLVSKGGLFSHLSQQVVLLIGAD
jgi:hypothetical protein